MNITEREKTLAVLIAAFVILYVLFFFVYAIPRLKDMNEECESKNGILVKTIEGTKCFDRSMLL